eukprot:TRINITY_DN48190_c0_g1_i1.p1 TRINITY_DN48190_c0_g1~~TRINITY_DN48190_c0_g1_i1.p1  ORF type:complete len:1028 (-),score=191.68 TRINITY_DN48190_c0_g1_i1:547-3630(-)
MGDPPSLAHSGPRPQQRDEASMLTSVASGTLEMEGTYINEDTGDAPFGRAVVALEDISDPRESITVPVDIPHGSPLLGNYRGAMEGASSPLTRRSMSLVEYSHTMHKSHNHHMSRPMDAAKALKMGGLSFAPIYNEIDNAQRQTKVKAIFPIMSVGLQGLTGAIVGTLAYILSNLSERLQGWRLQTILEAMSSHEGGVGWFLGWLVCWSIMTFLALIAAAPVIFSVRTAGSSGIPQVVALLNGCDLRAQFTWKTLGARFFGVVLAVSSGLAVGPEGPMIFIGACTGALLAQIPSSPAVWRYFGRPPSSMNEHVYLRDYVSTGAACGIAAAFRAPIAGTVFVIEEASSHFKKEHLIKIFFGSIVAMTLAVLLTDVDPKGHTLFEYSVTVGENCSQGLRWFQPLQFASLVLIGAACGLAGALFNHCNVKMTELRAKYANPTMPLRRFLDVVAICFLTSLCWSLLPALATEHSSGDPTMFREGTSCVKQIWFDQIMGGGEMQNWKNEPTGWRLKYSPRRCLLGVQYNQSLCPQVHERSQGGPGADNARACTVGIFDGTSVEWLDNYQDYCCAVASMAELEKGNFMIPSNTTCDINLGNAFPSLSADADKDAEAPGDNYKTYNPMAALTLAPFNQVANNLFSRGAPHIYPVWALLVFVVVFFILAAITAGSAVPSGLLLPMIIVGACIGRAIMLGLVGLQKQMRWYEVQTADSSDIARGWTHLFQFAGGPLPDSAPLATKGWLDPGMGALVGSAAMLGGTSRCVLMTTVMMVEITGDPMMIAPVGIATLTAVIIANFINHGLYHALIDVASFPFLPDRWPKEIPRALKVENVLPSKARMRKVVCISYNAEREAVEKILKDNQFTCFPLLDRNGKVAGIVSRGHLNELLTRTALDDDEPFDVVAATDFNYISVKPSMPLEVAYNLFRRMEVSHMLVTTQDNEPLAMLSRGSMLPWAVELFVGPRIHGSDPKFERPRNLRAPGSSPRVARPYSSSDMGTFDMHLGSEPETGGAAASSSRPSPPGGLGQVSSSS